MAGRNTYTHLDQYKKQQERAFKKAYEEVFRETGATNQDLANIFECTLSQVHKYKSGQSVIPNPLLFEHLDKATIRKFNSIFQRELWNL